MIAFFGAASYYASRTIAAGIHPLHLVPDLLGEVASIARRCVALVRVPRLLQAHTGQHSFLTIKRTSAQTDASADVNLLALARHVCLYAPQHIQLFYSQANSAA